MRLEDEWLFLRRLRDSLPEGVVFTARKPDQIRQITFAGRRDSSGSRPRSEIKADLRRAVGDNKAGRGK